MSVMIVKTMEFKGEDLLAEHEHEFLEITDADADGRVEIALDITPKTTRLYINLSLHELVRLAMIEGRKKES